MSFEILQQHLKIPLASRNEEWERALFAQIPSAQVKVLHQQPQAGPDGFAYLLVEVTDEGEPVTKIIQWLKTRGIGLALNPRKTYPDYVFTYGMIWNFCERGEFLTAMVARPSGDLSFQAGQKLWVGAPSEAYLPGYARNLIKQFLLDQGIVRPQIAMISEDQKNYDLAFSIESLKSPPAQEHAGIAEALSWFLPSHYSVALISENTVTGFVDL